MRAMQGASLRSEAVLDLRSDRRDHPARLEAVQNLRNGRFPAEDPKPGRSLSSSFVRTGGTPDPSSQRRTDGYRVSLPSSFAFRTGGRRVFPGDRDGGQADLVRPLAVARGWSMWNWRFHHQRDEPQVRARTRSTLPAALCGIHRARPEGWRGGVPAWTSTCTARSATFPAAAGTPIKLASGRVMIPLNEQGQRPRAGEYLVDKRIRGYGRSDRCASGTVGQPVGNRTSIQKPAEPGSRWCWVQQSRSRPS